MNIARFFASSFAESLVWRLIAWSDCEAACTASNALFTCPSPLRTDCGASAFYGCRKKGEERKIGRRCSGEEAQEAARLRREVGKEVMQVRDRCGLIKIMLQADAERNKSARSRERDAPQSISACKFFYQREVRE